MKSPTSRLQLWTLAILVPAFSVAIFFESVAKYYMPALHVPNSTLYARAVFWAVMLLFIPLNTLRGRRIPSTAWKIALILLLYSIFGLWVGVARDSGTQELISHLSHIVGAAIIILSTSMVSFPALKNLRSFLQIPSILILIPSGLIILSTIFQISTAIHVAITINALAVPFVATMMNRQRMQFLASAVLILLSIKRGLWLAAVVTVALDYPKKALLTFLGFGAVGLAALLFMPDDSLVYQLVVIKFLDGQSDNFDSLTSGRLGIFTSLFYTLEANNAFLTGLGFGAVFDANLLSDVSAMTWITNGVDVSFGHFWFLHGYLFGSIMFLLYSYISLAPLLWSRRSGDQLMIFLSKTSLFLYIASLSTFIAWEPLHWVVIGLSLARQRETSRAL